MNSQVPAHHDDVPANTGRDHDAMSMKLAAPDRVGQGTAIEQSRAVAEVQASVILARQFPRDTTRALADMRESCHQIRLAEKAFFRFPRGGQTVSGASVHLARDLARCWGNIDYGVKELRRDDDHRQSEMLAFAWDKETNARSETIFIVPHMRDKKGGPQALTDMRDIYENNANNGARRLRECIFSVLPPWYVDEAKEVCQKTLRDGGGKPLAQRVADCIAVFAEIGIRQEQLEKKQGRAAAKWDGQDVGHLGVVYKSIRNGEISKEEEFGADQNTVSAADITGEKKPAPASRPDPKPGADALAEDGNLVEAEQAADANDEAAVAEAEMPPAPTLILSDGSTKTFEGIDQWQAHVMQGISADGATPDSLRAFRERNGPVFADLHGWDDYAEAVDQISDALRAAIDGTNQGSML